MGWVIEMGLNPLAKIHIIARIVLRLKAFISRCTYCFSKLGQLLYRIHAMYMHDDGDPTKKRWRRGSSLPVLCVFVWRSATAGEIGIELPPYDQLASPFAQRRWAVCCAAPPKKIMVPRLLYLDWCVGVFSVALTSAHTDPSLPLFRTGHASVRYRTRRKMRRCFCHRHPLVMYTSVTNDRSGKIQSHARARARV